ncbi:hypothetical protein AB0J82_09355 [Asanoa sp. NPDC049518]|uniref:hypothetical protein n=1 Tax=unclassified Asanoa TaxID=2685164 RepID=UPI003445CD6E
MQVWNTPRDRLGLEWRIEVRDTGRVDVFRRTGRRVGNAPLRHPRDLYELGGWLVERGIDPERLMAA